MMAVPDPDRFMPHLEPPPKPTPQQPSAAASSEPKVELTAAFLERLLKDKSQTLEPVARLLGGFYKNLKSHGIPEQLAMACVLKVLDGVMANWILTNRIPPRRDESTDTESE